RVAGDVRARDPVPHEGRAKSSLALRDIVLVVGEDVVDPAGMQIDVLAEVAGRHGRTLDVPAGKASAPRGRPAERASRFGALPQREVSRRALVRIELGPDAFA